jgi:hypothetical protein
MISVFAQNENPNLSEQGVATKEPLNVTSQNTESYHCADASMLVGNRGKIGAKLAICFLDVC